MAKGKRRSLEFKRQVVERMRTCGDVTALAEELKLDRSLLYTWKRQLEGRPEKRRANLSQTRETAEQQKLWAENQQLKQVLAEKVLEADFFAAALRRVEEQRQNNTETGGGRSTAKFESGATERKAD